MTESKTLGTWHNPPLAYVVAELVFSPHYKFEEFVPALQDELRNDYPRTIEAKEIAVESEKPAVLPLWQLLSEDQMHGVQLGTRAISLHATKYIDSPDFLRRWGAILKAIESVKLGIFVERAGLRYIDLIVPSDNHSPSDYLNERIQGFSPPDATSMGSMTTAQFLIQDCVYNLRTAAPAPQGLLLPPNLNALQLLRPKVLVDAELRVASKKAIGYIDSDCMKDIQRSFDVSNLVGVYDGMQKVVSRTFRAAISQLAKKEWE